MARFGELLKAWRVARGVTQLQLANAAETSQRHLSFVESGRSTPSEAFVLRLARLLGLGVRDRNTLLVTAGHAPRFGTSDWNSPALAGVRRAARLMLDAHAPHPGFVLDARSTVLDANDAALHLIGANRSALGQLNLVELVLAPGPVRDAIVNFEEVAGFLLSRLQEAALYRGPTSTVQPVLERARGLAKEAGLVPKPGAVSQVLLPLEFRVDGDVRRWFTTVTTFGAPQDAFVEEITIELFHPHHALQPELSKT